MEIGLALLAVLGTLAGLIVGSVLDRGFEGRRWLRDHRARAYDLYIEGFQEMRQLLREMAIAHRDTERWETAHEGRRHAWKTYNYALVQVELYGSARAYELTLVVDQAVRAVSTAISPEQVTVAEWQAIRKRMDAALRPCIDQYRREFRLDRHPNRDEWVNAEPSAAEPQDLRDTLVASDTETPG